MTLCTVPALLSSNPLVGRSSFALLRLPLIFPSQWVRRPALLLPLLRRAERFCPRDQLGNNPSELDGVFVWLSFFLSCTFSCCLFQCPLTPKMFSAVVFFAFVEPPGGIGVGGFLDALSVGRFFGCNFPLLLVFLRLNRTF